MKKLSTLLTQRQALLRHARLANLAFAYTTLSDFDRRITRARLTGRVSLKHASPEADRYWPTLTALDHHQSVIDEHFGDEDLMVLADVVDFALGQAGMEISFRFDDFAESFLAPLRTELEREGIAIDRSDAHALP